MRNDIGQWWSSFYRFGCSSVDGLVPCTTRCVCLTQKRAWHDKARNLCQSVRHCLTLTSEWMIENYSIIKTYCTRLEGITILASGAGWTDRLLTLVLLITRDKCALNAFPLGSVPAFLLSSLFVVFSLEKIIVRMCPACRPTGRYVVIYLLVTFFAPVYLTHSRVPDSFIAAFLIRFVVADLHPQTTIFTSALTVLCPQAKDVLIRCAGTALNSKLISSQKGLFAPMVVQALSLLDQQLLDLSLVRARVSWSIVVFQPGIDATHEICWWVSCHLPSDRLVQYVGNEQFSWVSFYTAVVFLSWHTCSTFISTFELTWKASPRCTVFFVLLKQIRNYLLN